MKALLLKLILAFTLLTGSFNLNAQVYYWVGGSGNWTDTLHWSNSSGGTPNAGVPPTPNNMVVFDGNSFSAAGQVVTIDTSFVEIYGMRWDLDSTENLGVIASNYYNPSLVSLNTTDTLIIGSTFLLHNTMSSYGYKGTITLTGGLNDSLVSAGHSLLNDLIIDTYDDTLKVVGNVTTSGNIYYKRGGLFVDNITVTCGMFDSHKSGGRALHADNTIFNLTGQDTVLYIKEMDTITGSNRIINVTNATTDNIIQIGLGGLTYDWGTLNLLNKNIRFFKDSWFGTISPSTSIERIEIAYAKKLKTGSFGIDGDCGRYIDFIGDQGGGQLENGAIDWNLDYFQLKNLTCNGVAITATNAIDLGGNTNWTLTEDNTTSVDYYWVGGQGNFYSDQHWALSSGGAVTGCVPTPNDNAFFDANSYAASGDTLFLWEKVRITTLDMSGLDDNIIVSGYADTVEIRQDILGSGNIQFDWSGIIKMVKNGTCSITTGTNGQWNSNFIKSGTGTLNFADDFNNLQDFIQRNGAINTNSNDLTLYSYYCNQSGTTKDINIMNSNINITGAAYNVDPATIGNYYVAGSSLNFIANNILTEFKPGTDSLETVSIQNTTTVRVLSDSLNYNTLLDIGPGSTIIFSNFSDHVFDELYAVGTCDSLVTIKSSNTTYGAATLQHPAVWSNNLNVDFAIIDNVKSGSGLSYLANSSVVSDSSLTWITSAGTSTATVTFTIEAPNDTIAQGTNATIVSNSTLTIPANAVVVSSILTLDGVDTTGATTLDKCNVQLTGASTYGAQALTPPTVSTISLNTTTLPGANGNVNLILSQNNGPAGEFVVDTAYLTVQFYLPYAPTVDTFYWYGDSGDWSDLNHWSHSSGNIPPDPATCLPSTGDHVVFDDLSFSSDGQTVTVSNESYFGSMTWALADDSASLIMSENLTASNDVTWSPLLTITTGSSPGVFKFRPRYSEALLDPNGASVDVNLELISTNLNDTLSLLDTLDNGDFKSIVLYGGVFNTNDNYIHSNSLLITSAFTPTELNLGSSMINLTSGYADNGKDSSFVNSGTSSIIVDHNNLVSTNYFKGNSKTFYDVQLYFNTNNYSAVTGNNVFDSLTVGAGSKIRFDSLSVDTVLNKFQMRGTCVDSIFLKSSGTTNGYTLASSAPLDAMCLSVRDAAANTIAAGSFTTYFSTNVANNSGAWVFDASASTTAYLDTMLNFCYGDTVVFADTSVAFQNDNANLTSIWNFGDGQTFTGDTTMHYYSYPGVYTFQLVSQYSNLCTDTIIDTIEIFAPSVSLYSSIGDTVMCYEQPVTFTAYTTTDSLTQSYFEFIVNGMPTSVPTLDSTTLDTLNLPNPSLISVNLYENGCKVSSDTIEMDVLPVPTVTLNVASSTICTGDTVTFTGSGANVYQYYKNGTAVTPFTALPYVVTTITNGDTYYAIGKNDTTSCADTSNVINFTVNPLPSITSFVDSDADNVICFGDTVTFTGTSATATTYNLYINDTLVASSPTSSIDLDTLSNGDQVYMTVQNVQTCYSPPSSMFTYIVNPIPNVTLTSTVPSDSICEGTSVQFTAGNASQYEFFVNGVSTGAASATPFYTTDTIVNGDIITVEGDQFSCIGTSPADTFTVTPLPVTTLISDLGDTICQGEQIIATANSALATDYEFLLNGISQASGPSNTYTYSTLANGDLISVIATYNGCTYTDPMPITVFSNPNPSLFSSDTDLSICEQDAITFTATGGNTYEYFVNADSVWAGTGPYLTDSLPAGTDTVTVLATNTITGCSTLTSGMIVDVIELPITTLSSTATTICDGETVQFTANSTVATDFQFFVNTQSQAIPGPSNTFSTSLLNDGDMVLVYGYNNGCANPGNDTIYFTVNPNPVASIAGTTVFCQGAPETFTGSSTIAGSTFEFIIDGTSEPLGVSYDASVLSSGTHTIQLVVSSPAGCNDTTFTNVTVLDNPVVAFTGNNNICAGELTTFAASGASTYQFYVNGNPATTSSVYSADTLNNGDIVSLEGVSSAGCTSVNTAQIVMNVTPTPTVTLVSDDADNILCTGDNVTFTANGATNYEFFINGFSQGAPSGTNIFSTTSLTNGQTVTVQGESLGCIDYTTAGITFSVSNSPVVNLYNAADTVLCIDSTTVLVATGADEYLFYINGVAQGVYSTMDTLSTLLSNGDVVTVDGMTNTCVTTAGESYSFSVFDYPATALTSSDADNIICYGEQVTFTGSGALDYEYFIDGLSMGNTGPVLVTDQLQDGQTVTLIGYNAECPGTAPQALTFTVNTLNLNTSMTPNNFMICEGDALTVNASGADEYEIFVNNVSQGAQSANSTFILNNLNDGDFITLNGYSIATGCTQTDDQTVYVQVFGAPAITVDANNTICEGDSTILISNNLYGNQWYLDGMPIAGATDTAYVAYVSGDYSLEITNGGAGEIWSVGYNANGEFGDNTNFNNNLPSQADVLTDIVKVTSGISHTLSLESNGNLYVNGDNSSGQLGNGTFTASNSPVLITTVPAIADAAASENSSVVAATTGEVFTWGGNNDGQLGLGNTIVYNTPQWVIGITGITNVAAGRSHFLLLKSDGTVWSVGNNDFGQLGMGNLQGLNVFTQIPGLSNIVSISAGDYHSMAIDNTGTLYVWGDNSHGQLGTNDLNNRTSPTVSPLDNVSVSAGGNGHSLFVTNDNKVYATGANNFGQLGTGDYVDRDSPVQLTDIDAVVSVSSGGYHSLFHKNDGSVWGAGRNDNYQLGDLAAMAIEFISQVPNVEGVTYIDGGNESSHFIYGNSAVCNSATETITVLSAPQPIITYAGGVLSTTATGISYEWFINDIPIINSNIASITPSASGDYTVAVTYSNGCVSVSDPFTYWGVGVEELDLLNSLSLYPNPTDGEFVINWDAGLEIESLVIYDAFGKELTSFSLATGTNTIDLNLSGYTKGMYNIKLKTTSGSTKTLKVVKN